MTAQTTQTEPETEPGTRLRAIDACRERGGPGVLVRDLLGRVGDKWSLMIIHSLHEGPLRFTALQQVIGEISQRMLTLNLRQLERDGLITRTVYPEVPPRVEYELTGMGRSLLAPVLELVEWAVENTDRVQTARDTYDTVQNGTK